MHRSTAEAARLLIWFSPSFPTGAFGFSHGLEWAVEAEDVGDADSLREWLAALLAHGGGWSDAVLVAAAHRATTAADWNGLDSVAELALALQPTRERRLEASVQGEAFLKAVATGWPDETLARLRHRHEAGPCLPVAVGAACGQAGMALEPVLVAFLTRFAANLVSAAIRLAPIGQSDGLRVLAGLEPKVAEVAGRAATSSLDDVGACALRSDIASMRHETQVTRLFRS